MPVLAVGWDGVDGRLVSELLDAGRLPALASIRDRGCWREISHLPGLGDDALWSTFSTGVGPGEHGRFMYARQPAGSSVLEKVPRSEPSPVPPFWAELGRGATSYVLDVPKSPLARVPGTREVHDWMSHGSDGAVPTSWPVGLASDFTERPFDDFRECYGTMRTESEMAHHADALTERRNYRTSTIVELLRRERADLWLVVYAEGHCAGHHFHHLHDPRTDADIALAAAVGDPLVDQIVGLDHDLAAMLRALGSDVAVLVFSLAGMDHADSTVSAVRAAVYRLSDEWTADAGPGIRLRSRLGRVASARSPLAKRQQRDLLGRAFYPVTTNSFDTPVRISVRGRDPWGIVPASERDSVEDWIATQLLALTDHDGAALVLDIIRVREAYPGPFSDRYADLIALLPRRFPADPSSTGGAERGGLHPRGGDHMPGGWLVTDFDETASGSVPVAELSRLIQNQLELIERSGGEIT